MKRERLQNNDSCCPSVKPAKAQSIFAPRSFAPPMEEHEAPAAGPGIGFSLVDISILPRETIQPKLVLGPVGDKYEEEADRVARQVDEAISSSDHKSVQRREDLEDEEEPELEEALEEEEELRRKVDGLSTTGGADVGPDLESAICRARGRGQPLSDGVRQPMERAFGADFGGVRVHADGEADSLNRSLQARAFTTGQDIFLRQGEYRPGSSEGQRLLAHELTHLVQQNGSRVKQTRNKKDAASANDNKRLNNKDDVMTAKMLTNTLPIRLVQNEMEHVEVQVKKSKSEPNKSDYSNVSLPLGAVFSEVSMHAIQPGTETILRQPIRYRFRSSTRAQSHPYADPRGRTRGASSRQAVLHGANLPEPPRNLLSYPFKFSADGTRLWDGMTRPSWAGADENFILKQPNKPVMRANGTLRTEYYCLIGRNTNDYLPRHSDADLDEDFVTVGHKKQWRDYIIENAVTIKWPVEGGEIWAIALEEAKRWYSDERNLELQGQKYNSSIARVYKSDPPGQEWV